LDQESEKILFVRLRAVPAGLTVRFHTASGHRNLSPAGRRAGFFKQSGHPESDFSLLKMQRGKVNLTSLFRS
jgi:hypothetical protein